MNQWWGDSLAIVVGDRLVGGVGVIFRLATVARRRAEVSVGGGIVLEALVVEGMLMEGGLVLAECGLEVVNCWVEGGGGFRFREKRWGRLGIGARYGGGGEMEIEARFGACDGNWGRLSRM